jgi:hypothetical protein
MLFLKLLHDVALSAPMAGVFPINSEKMKCESLKMVFRCVALDVIGWEVFPNEKKKNEKRKNENRGRMRCREE